MAEVERVLDVRNEVGEGPLWNVEEQALYWVDIEAGHFYRFYPAEDRYERFEVGLPVGVLAFRASGGLVMATRDGFGFWDPKTETISLVGDPEPGKPNARFNDGAVDRQGRFWAGTMHSGSATSSLYRLDPDGSIHTMETGITVSNGIGWSPDNKTMYFTDSRRRTIRAYDFDLATGAIENWRPFVDLSDEDAAEGNPDGLCVDSEGFVWSARFWGWKVVRYDPNGRVEREIRLPVQNVTSCTFGGEQLDELYITTAWAGLTEEQLGNQPLAGDLFRLKTEVEGLEEPKFLG